jgi:hypothetical protein
MKRSGEFKRTTLAVISSGLLFACTARISGTHLGASASGGSSGTAGGSGQGANTGVPGLSVYPSDPSTCAKAPLSVARTPIRRLSRIEYNNILRDLFGDSSSPADKFVAEDLVAGFTSNSLTPPTDLNAEQYFAEAEQLSKCIVEGTAPCAASNYATLSGCSSVSDTACAQTYLDTLERRAFRGTVSPDEKTRIAALYQDAQSIDANAALELGIQAILLSPSFLFVLEFGSGADTYVALTPSELASRLSLSLWRSVPDQTLLDAVDAGHLSSAADVMAQADRMLNDDRAAPMRKDFVEQWSGIERLQNITYQASDVTDGTWPATVTDWPTLRGMMETETLDFFDLAVKNGGTLSQLLSTNSTFGLSPELATMYGATVDPTWTTSPQRFLLPPNRSGLLMQASVLASQSHPLRPSPVLRGKTIRTALFCSPPQPPPANVNQNLADPSAVPGQTTTDVLNQHASNPQCASCHQLIDPIGNAFNHFNQIGAYQDRENGAAVVTSGEFNSLEPLTGSFSDAQSMIQEALAKPEVVGKCYTLQGFRYALGRSEAEPDACAVQQIYDDFAGKDFTIRDLIIAITGSEAFLYRTRVRAGAACQ